MEDLQPISAAKQSAFCVEMLKRLNIQREQDYLCDITLVSKDNCEFKAHRNVLSAASPFFCRLLQCDMKENHQGIIRFDEISGSVMEDVLEFIYTGTVEVTQENTKELIATGNYLMIPSLKTVSGRFLEGEMSNSNCISTFYFAEKYDCVELIGNSTKFIHENFASVGEMDEFLSLEAKEVARWISSDKIAVEAEASIFKIILKWVEHNKSERIVAFEELFPHVRLSFLSRDCLEDIVTNELVRENLACVKLVMEATTKMATFVDDDDLPKSPRKGYDTRVIVARGGKCTFCYLPEEDLWKRLPDGLKESTFSTQMIKFRDQLFAFKDYDNQERYDPVFNVWSELNLNAGSAKVAVLKGEIYAVDVDICYRKSSTKRYNVEKYKWETLHSSNELYRQNTCVVAAGSHLYVFGGRNPDSRDYSAKAERFDTVENKWEEIADMLEGRGEAFGVASQEKVFVAGGISRRGRLKTCEMYTTSTNEWQCIANLNVPRYNGSIVCLNGKLYVLGGKNGRNQTELSVEYFHPANKIWIHKTTIPVTNIDPGNKNAFTASVLKLSRDLIDKLSIVGE
ncbi:kelch-like protein 2 [Stylophora pistillata]|uniref:kelch-like protein 2 n=1 Tax=Stylophora pistillata TaxID=50429 RepID=UPI000C057ACA|nr:kelch-like protein 2 [Stylophora pistillata]